MATIDTRVTALKASVSQQALTTADHASRLAVVEANVGKSPTISVSAPLAIAEGNNANTPTIFQYTLTLTRYGYNGPVGYTYTSRGDVNAADFTGGVMPSGSGTFIAGENTKVVRISINPDADIEPNEDFYIDFYPRIDLTPFTAKGTIINDDSAVGATTRPVVTANSDRSVLTATPGTWPSGTTFSGQWYRDGSPMNPAVTSLMYNRIASTDDGTAIQYIETSGTGVLNRSNAMLYASSTLTYTTSFVAADNTNLNGFENWSQTGAQAFAIVGNDLVQIAASPYNVRALHPTDGNDFEVEFTPYTLAPATGNRSPKYIFLRYTDASNYVVVNIDQNNYSITKRVGGTDQALKSYTNRTFDDGVPVRLRIQGDYLRFYYNGSEISDSSTANGGKGFDVSGVAPSSQIAIAGSGSSSLTYPQKFLYGLSIYALPADGISFNATISNPNKTPGRQAISLSGSTQGTVTQPQALVISSTGRILQNWTNVTLASDKTFAATLPEITQDAEGDAVVIWMRDANKKTTTRTGLLPGGIVPIQHHAIDVNFGLNTQNTWPYSRATIFVDLFKSMALGIRGSGFYFANIVASHINLTGTALVDSNGKPVACPAADAGMRSDGWPTAAPRTGAWPTDSRIALQFNPGSSGASPEQAGTYDVTFTPGLEWTVDSAQMLKRTAYDPVAGTATLVLTGNLANQVTPFIDFVSYNGVANTFPPVGQAFFKSVRRGENANSAFTAKTISSWTGLTSAAKTGGRTFKGALRFMTNNDINGPARTGYEFTNTRKRVPQTRLGYVALSGPITIEEMLQACIEAGTHLWLNIPDTCDPTLVKGWADYLYANMPAGMQVLTEFSNEIIFNFAGGFSQYFRMNDRAKAAGVGYRTQLSREIKSRLALPFNSVFGMADDRWTLVVGMAAFDFQSGDATSDNKLAEMLDEGDLWQYTRGTCIAAYVGNGLNYVDGGSAGGFMSKASRDKAGIDDTGWLNDYFAAQILMSDWTRENYWNPQCNALARYCAKKGLPRGRMTPMLYEYSWHHSDEKDNNKVSLVGSITENTLNVTTNNNGPLRVGDILVGSGITTGTKVTAQTGGTTGKEGTYTVDTNQTVPTTTITSANNLYAVAAGAAMSKAIRDPRAGVAVNYMDAWLRLTGGFLMHFDHVGWTPPTLFGYIGQSNWGYMEEIGRESTESPYKEVAADMRANG